ncbi:hypothetical protein [Maribacter sp. MAR_2009_72]|uniref:hypothetical protein n=1 Tax=Maribacter sp. MAR_2009_72 TaxID=1250050 RepID=UPI00119A0361|nr:hypothetical protein [Maribacter sp. MAR_2009_72]TVZ15621.1 hypothetical protein JM81_1871 [Maribacter sp. MAR_2009_72]
MNRKTFIKNSLGGIVLAGVAPTFTFAQDAQEPEPLDIKLVKEFVVAGHKNLPLVKEMLDEYPNLIYASYDWGNSDYEEAIEGAAHLGNKEIANYLISKGARVNLFTLTMLGKIELVKATLEVYPELLFAKGPHGFTLLHHANIGDAKELSDYLKEKGLKETHVSIK